MNQTVQSRLERILEATTAKLAEKKTIRREYNTELEQVITLLLSFSFCWLSNTLFSPCQESLRLSVAALRSTKARRRRRMTDLKTSLVEMPGLQQRLILSAAPRSDGQAGTINNSGTSFHLKNIVMREKHIRT